jgi:coproporphyrinogen III oxidase-like Fe-S oxidoreductase
MGAVSTVAGLRHRNLPGLGRYLRELASGAPPPREVEELDTETLVRERLMLGLRLDERLALGAVAGALDHAAAERLAAHGLVELTADNGRSTVALTRRGRFLGGGVTAELLA